MTEMIENKSEIYPTEYKVLIYPMKVEEKTKGGLYLAPSAVDKEKYAVVKGVLVDVGSLAFTGPDWGDRKPKKGDLVYYDRYAGGLTKGTDGEDYRLINDKEICAILGKGHKNE